MTLRTGIMLMADRNQEPWIRFTGISPIVPSLRGPGPRIYLALEP